jgi:hypothetical protein
MKNFKFLQKPITIEIVDNFLKEKDIKVNFKLMLAVQPFMEYYVECPVGFAETNNLNDIDECVEIIRDINRGLNLPSTIRQETQRFLDGHNAGSFGRYIGRLAYLLKNK